MITLLGQKGGAMLENLLQDVPERIIKWHRKHKRPLPWRTDASAYHTWLSEIMLQQTRIEAVIPYYYRFLEELPTIEHLANVPEDRLLKLWEGLGYYSRARNLKKAAQVVMEQYGGNLPVTAKELRSLPGIGDYTAGAIASMAFGQPEPAVDGNVLRVVTRITGDRSDIAQTAVKKRITERLRECYPTGTDAGDFTEGLMELGETVCIPAGNPRCEECPVKELCVANAKGMTLEIPVKSPKKQRKIQPKTVFLLRCHDRYAIQKRPDTGLLAGMWEFPNVDGELSKQQVKEQANEWGSSGQPLPLPSAVHVFTHIEWHLQGYLMELSHPLDGYSWVTAEELQNEIAIPVAFKKYKEWIIKTERSV